MGIFTPNRSANSAAFSLLEMLVAVGIMGAIVTQINYTMTEQIKIAKKVETDIDIEIMRSNLLKEINCINTRNAAANANMCANASADVVLYNNRNQMIGTGPAAVGGRLLSERWAVRARCPNLTTGIVVEAAHLDKTGAVAKDPISKKVLDFTNTNINPVLAGGLCVVIEPQVNTACGADQLLTGIELINGKYELKCDQVKEENIENLSIINANIRAQAVENIHIPLASLTNVEFGNNSIGTTQLASGAANGNTLKNDNVLAAHIAANAVRNTNIINNGLGTLQLQDGLASASNLPNSSITTAKIADGSVSAGVLADNSLDSAKIASGVMVGEKLKELTMTGFELANDSIHGANFLDNQFTRGVFRHRTIAAVDIALKSLRGTNFAFNSVNELNLGWSDIFEDRHFGSGAISFAKLSPCGLNEVYRYKAATSNWACSSIADAIQFSSVRGVFTGAGGFDSFSMQHLSGESIATGGWQLVKRHPVVAGAPPGIEDGIACNPALGWRMIACAYSDSSVLVDQQIYDAMNGLNDHFLFDRDHEIADLRDGVTLKPPLPGTANFGKPAACYTNDWNHPDNTTFPDGTKPLLKDGSYRIHLSATCVRVTK